MNISFQFRALALPAVLAAGMFCAVPSAPSCPPLLPLVTVTASDPSASEVGPNTGTFTVTRTGGNQSLPLTVYYSVSGTAGNGNDYQTLPGWVQIPAYATTANVTVTPLWDGTVEGTETVVLTVTDTAYYDLASPSSATVNIQDAPPATSVVTVAATDASASEVGPNTGTFTVTRTGGDQSSVLTVYYSLSGTAGNGSDYQTLPGWVQIPAYAPTANVTVTPLWDGTVEGTEAVVLTVQANASYEMGSPSSATVNIQDASVVTIAATDAWASELGPDPGTFTVTRTGGDLSGPLTVSLQTPTGTATPGADYSALPATVTIAAWAASAPITVTPLQEGNNNEGRETVILTLASSGNYVLGSPASATVTILDTPSVANGLVGYWAMDEGSGSAAGDASGNGSTGTLVNGPAWTGGRIGAAALSFDGWSAYVQVGAKPSLVMSSAMTIGVWARRSSTGTGILVNKEGEYEVGVANGEVRWAVQNTIPGWNWVYTGYVPPLNEWTHLTLVYDNGVVRTYANGGLVHTYNGAGAIGDNMPTLNDFRIGGRQLGPEYFAGALDEVRVYNRAVSTAEIVELAADGDELPDAWEMQYWGNLSQGAAGDPDGDGLTNFEEYVLGTNPTTYTSLNGLISGSGLLVFTPLK